jgi:hypothetical protein
MNTARRYYRKARAYALAQVYRLTAYTVHAGSEWQAVHHCRTLADSLRFAAAYPQSCPITITRRGRFVAAR